MRGTLVGFFCRCLVFSASRVVLVPVGLFFFSFLAVFPSFVLRVVFIGLRGCRGGCARCCVRCGVCCFAVVVACCFLSFLGAPFRGSQLSSPVAFSQQRQQPRRRRLRDLLLQSIWSAPSPSRCVLSPPRTTPTAKTKTSTPTTARS